MFSCAERFAYITATLWMLNCKHCHHKAVDAILVNRKKVNRKGGPRDHWCNSKQSSGYRIGLFYPCKIMARSNRLRLMAVLRPLQLPTIGLNNVAPPMKCTISGFNFSLQYATSAKRCLFIVGISYFKSYHSSWKHSRFKYEF